MIEIHYLKKGDLSPHDSTVWMWCLHNVLERPEMVKSDIMTSTTRLYENLDTDRIELFMVNEHGAVTDGMIFSECCEDLHFGTTPGLLGSWCNYPGNGGKLYKRALEILKEKGHKGVLRTMRVDERTYKTLYKEF